MELKKFNAKEWRKFYKNFCENSSEEELWKLYNGLLILKTTFNKFYKDKYGSPKRFDDLREYINFPTNELLKRINKRKNQELPY